MPIRNGVLDVLREYHVSQAGIRITEPNAKRPSPDRIQIEGVIQEAFASSDLKAYYVGQISSISARIGIPRGDFKKYISGELDFKKIEKWHELSEMSREAVFCALGAERCLL